MARPRLPAYQPHPKDRNPYLGVSWHVNDHRYRVKVNTHQKHVHLWNFEDPVLAARVRDVAALILQGPNAVLNFDGKPPLAYPRARVLERLIELGVVFP